MDDAGVGFRTNASMLFRAEGTESGDLVSGTAKLQ
jgi:hypothetical protein